VAVVDGLREHRRDSTVWHGDHAGVVRRALARPERSAAPGWEPVAACRDRVVAAVAGIREAHPDEPLVLVGHATAWTVLVAELTGSAPDPALREALRMPDLLDVEPH
jgi:broad specificity phosphatase PhoE